MAGEWAMKIRNLINIIFIFFLLGSSTVKAKEKIPFGLIIGENVTLTETPSSKSKPIYKCVNREIVFYLGKSEKNKEKKLWFKVKTQKKDIDHIIGWVEDKCFKLLGDNKTGEEKILKDLIDKEFYTQLFYDTFYYNPVLEIKKFNKKDYYIFTYQAEDMDPDDHQNYDCSCVYIKENDKLTCLTSISGNDAPFKFYDLNNDGYAEIIVSGTNFEKGLRVYSEKQRKNIFEFNLYRQKVENFKYFINNSRIELKEIDPGKSCEIIAYIREKKNKPMKKIVFKWNGETFVANK